MEVVLLFLHSRPDSAKISVSYYCCYLLHNSSNKNNRGVGGGAIVASSYISATYTCMYSVVLLLMYNILHTTSI
jgi:hypothetical protein